MREGNGVLIVRADAGPQIGTGHVMRCLALAQAWQETSGIAHFALAGVTAASEARLIAERMELHHLTAPPGSANDAAQIIALARQLEADWVVVDGYHFDADYQQALQQVGLRLLFIDDYGHACHYSADLVLNQNISADESLYVSREQYTHLLLGPRYALLRREFWPWRSWQREIPPVARKVLVTLGGSDPDNVTLKVIHALQCVQIEGLEAVVVVGGSNPHSDTLHAAVASSGCAIRLERNVTRMPELMAWADMAVSAGGSTCWESALMGLPALVLILADNQKAVAAGLDAAQVAINMGCSAHLTPTMLAQTLTELALSSEKRATIARRGQELVDGHGVMRVVQLMESYGLTLRLAQTDDCRLIWEWANDPITRAASFSPEPIPWEHHRAWVAAKLADSQSLFYIALDADATPVGQIRYDIEGQEAVVSVGLAPDRRGRGYGNRIIRLASQQVFESTPVTLIHAYIKPDNVASTRAFAKAGFVSDGTTEIKGHPALHFVLRREPLP